MVRDIGMKYCILSVVFVAMLLAAGCRTDVEPVAELDQGPLVVEGDGVVIPLNDYRVRLEAATRNDDDQDEVSPEKKLEIVNAMIDEELIYQEAVEQDIEKDAKTADKVRKAFEELMIRWLYKIEVTDKVTVTEEEIDAAFAELRAKDKAKDNARQIARRKAILKKQRQSFQLYEKELQKKAGLVFKQEGVELVIRKYRDAKARVLKETGRPYILSLGTFDLTDDEKEIAVAEYGDNKRLLPMDVFARLHEMSPPSRPLLTTPSAVQDLAKQALQQDLLLAEASKRKYEEVPEVIKALNEKKRRILSAALFRREVGEKVGEHVTDEKMRQYYEEHIDSYQRPTPEDPEKNETIPFEEAKDLVDREVWPATRLELDKAWKATLREGRKFVIHEDLL